MSEAREGLWARLVAANERPSPALICGVAVRDEWRISDEERDAIRAALDLPPLAEVLAAQGL